MRVITGTARGKKLKTLEGVDVRPTTDMVKEAVFSAIQFEIEGASALDLFGGSGQLGIEALSRGARHCVFVEKNREAFNVIKENVNSCGFLSKSRLLNMDSIEYLQVAKPGIDIAFLDPPYNNDIIQKALPLLDKKMSGAGIAVCEHEAGLELPKEIGRFKLKKRYRYGKTAVTIYNIKDGSEE